MGPPSLKIQTMIIDLTGAIPHTIAEWTPAMGPGHHVIG